MPECGSQVILCDLPVRLDTYEGCSHACAYCFAKKKRNIEDIKTHETAASVKKFVEGFRGREVKWVDWPIPLHWGGMSDPFQPAEAIRRASFEVLKVLIESQYPFVFSTKGRLAATDEYLNMFRQANGVAQVSLVDQVYDKWEPGAPPFKERLTMLPKLAAANKRLIVRVQPYMAGMAEQIVSHLADYKNAGVYGIVVEALKSFKKFPGGIKIGGDYCYPVDVLKRDFEIIREGCYKAGLAFYSGENRLRHMGDDKCCCGVVGVPGFEPNRANLNYLGEPGGIKYRPIMDQPGSGEPFRTLSQTTLGGGIANENPYRANMEVAAKTKTFLKIMGYIPETQDD